MESTAKRTILRGSTPRNVSESSLGSLVNVLLLRLPVFFVLPVLLRLL